MSDPEAVDINEVCCPDCGVGGIDIVQTVPADEDGLAEFRCSECGEYFTEFVSVPPAEEEEAQPQRWVEQGGRQVAMDSRERMVEYGGAWLAIMAGSKFGQRRAWYRVVGHGVETRLVLKDRGDDSNLAGNSQVLSFDGMSPGKAWDAIEEMNSHGSGHVPPCGCHACDWSIWVYAGRPPVYLLNEPYDPTVQNPGRVAFNPRGLFDPEASMAEVTADDLRAAIDWKRDRLELRVRAIRAEIARLNDEFIVIQAQRQNLDRDYRLAESLTTKGHALRTKRIMALDTLIVEEEPGPRF